MIMFHSVLLVLYTFNYHWFPSVCCDTPLNTDVSSLFNLIVGSLLDPLKVRLQARRHVLFIGVICCGCSRVHLIASPTSVYLSSVGTGQDNSD